MANIRPRYRLLVAVAVVFQTGCAASAAIPPPEHQLLAREVQSFFEAKCGDCHGPQLARPKGHLGYLLDLERVADNDEIVVRGSPESSELLRLLDENEMPPDEPDLTPASSEEKALVRRWIELGAPSVLPATATPESITVSPPPRPFIRLAGLVGRFHPALVHFPVALIVLAALLAFLPAAGEASNAIRRFVLRFAALSALLATATGLIDAAIRGAPDDPAFAWHRLVGIAVAILSLALVWMDQRGSRGAFFRWTLVIVAILTLAAGFLGGVLVYGWQHYAF